MKLSESWSFSLSNLAEMKMRTALTAIGVTVGIGALVAMIGFGNGMQRNVEESFEKLDLLKSVTVLPGGTSSGRRSAEDPDVPEGNRSRPAPPRSGRALDAAAVAEIAGLDGVESVFPDVRFPAAAGSGENMEFRLIQVLPARVTASKIMRLSAGRPFRDDEEEGVIVGASILKLIGAAKAEDALGRPLTISSLALDPAVFSEAGLAGLFSGRGGPLKRVNREFPIVGVLESAAFGGPANLAGDVILPPGPAARIEKLPFTSVWDLFRDGEGRSGYSALNVRLRSPAYADPIKAQVKKMGFDTFALIDQFEQVKKSFAYMKMMLAAVAMIAIFVAALGIVNTMVMSILERYAEIGIMKAVGAARRDIRRIFLVEAGLIGFAGGIGGLLLGWGASRIINRVVNYFLAREGMPFVEFFRFPLWLCLGGIAFAVGVSLVAGVYPALRAARVDPVVALRHE
jgi:putative ABC transport system permease protein